MSESGNRSSRNLNNFEFTPIGYMKEKQNGNSNDNAKNDLKRPNDSPSYSSNHQENNPVLLNEERPRKARRTSIDNTMNSTKMFNDSSQFDDTLPLQANLLLQKPNNINNDHNNKRNLMPELKENALASNPLKEQQEQLHRLNTENYNLRLKCNSLLKFLNNVTDEGELKKSLGLLEEIHDWKQKYQRLNQEYTELKNKFDDLELKSNLPMTTAPASTTTLDYDRYVKECSHLKDLLEKNNVQLYTFKNEVNDLEQKCLNLQKQQKDKQEQHQLETNMLKSNINNLNVNLVTKEDELEDKAKKIQRLTNQLQEFDHKGSESLLELENQLDLRSNTVKNLEDELHRLTASRQSLESQLQEKETKIKEINARFESYRKDVDGKLNNNDEDQHRQEIKQHAEIQQLIDEKTKLNNTISQLQKEYNDLKNKFKENELSLKSLQMELERTKKKMGESDALSRQLQNQIIENTTKNSERVSQRIKEKELEIEDLKTQLKEKSSKLRSDEERFQDSIQSELRALQSKNDIEKKRLEREISLLREERDALGAANERELDVWKNKCESLTLEIDKMLKKEIDSMSGIKRKLIDKEEEIVHLNKLLERSRMEKLDLTEKLSEAQRSKDTYKEELKKVASRLEYLTKEYIKLKEKRAELAEGDEKGIQSLKEKYNNMKQRLLDELKTLQEENLSLERRLLESKGNSSQMGNSQRSNSSPQDRIDYYKLKYHTEVKQNNDLKIMNEYLNRVLRASSQHVRLDLLKIENEVSKANVPHPGNTYNNDFTRFGYNQFNENYKYFNGLSPTHRMKFKTIALFILACVRMKQTAIRRKWDEQRIRYLQRKIAVDDDRITW